MKIKSSSAGGGGSTLTKLRNSYPTDKKCWVFKVADFPPHGLEPVRKKWVPETRVGSLMDVICSRFSGGKGDFEVHT